jgi:hypothetical protein
MIICWLHHSISAKYGEVWTSEIITNVLYAGIMHDTKGKFHVSITDKSTRKIIFIDSRKKTFEDCVNFISSHKLINSYENV